MTAALARRFPGAVVDHVAIEDVAAGTNARARVRLGYRHGHGPESVFVKREGSVLNRLALSVLGAVEAEARLVAAEGELPLEHPRLYAAATDHRRLAAVVVMEDVTARGARPNDATVPLTPDQVRDGLDGLARLHARHWARHLPPVLEWVRPWRLNAGWSAVSWPSLARGLALVHKHGGGAAHGLDARAIDRGFRGWARTAERGPQTLLHGDPHPGNTYTLPSGGIGFYDWQLVRTGTWVHDVGYFVVGSLATADRREHERDLLQHYLRRLAAEGVTPPQPDSAWRLYRETPVFGLGSWLHTLSGGGFQPVQLCLATIERFAAAYAELGPEG